MPFVAATLRSIASARADAIDGLIADAASGELVTEVAKTFPLNDAATALSELETAHPRGKFVLIP